MNDKFRKKLIIGSIKGVILFTFGLLTAQESQEKIDFGYGERLYKEKLFDLAVIQFQNFIDDYPNSTKVSEAQFLLAESNFSLQHYDEAIKAYLEIIIKYSNFTSADYAQFRIGECFEKIGKRKEAVESYFRVYSYYSESKWILESLYRISRISMEMGNFNKAQSILKLILEINSSNEYRSKAILLLGEVYLKTKEYEKAIQTLNIITKKPVREADQVRAILLIGEIQEVLGNWNESEIQFRNIVKITDNKSLKQHAWYRLGLIYNIKGMDIESIKAFQKVIGLEENKDLKIKALSHLGQLKMKQRDFESALEFFKSVEEQSINPELKQAAKFNKAQCFEYLGKFYHAVDEYEKIVKDSSKENSIFKKGLLSLANLSTELENFEKAVNCYNRYIILFKEDPLISGILLKKGKICLKELGLWDEGFAILRQIWNDFPMSSYIPEARFIYAEGLEDSGKLEDAYYIYEMIIQRYSGTQWAYKAKERLDEIKTYRLVDYKKAFSKINELFQKSLLNKTNPSLFLELGLMCIYELKEYNNAINYLNKYILVSSDSTKIDSVLLYVGKCYESLYRIENIPAFLDSAKNIYTNIYMKDFKSQVKLEAGIRLAQWKSLDSTEAGLKMYNELLEKYLGNDREDEILFQIGKLYFRSDSLNLGLKFFEQLIKIFPKSNFLEESLYHSSKILLEMKNIAKADSMLELYTQKFPKGRFLPQVLFSRGKLEKDRKNYEIANSIFEDLKSKYFYSPWADSGCIYIGELYLQTGNYSKAAELYKICLERDSLKLLSYSTGLSEEYESNKKVFLLGLANSYSGLKKYKKAKEYYLKYAREYNKQDDKKIVYLSLANIAENEGKPFRAIDYLKNIIKETVSDSILQVLGNLHFRQGQYEEAVSVFDRALGTAVSSENQTYISSRIIVSLLRQDKIPQAEVRMKVFEKSFKNNSRFQEYFAELILEKGKAYLRKKEFDQALQSFKDIISKYKNTKYVPYAELEIGKTYLITNKIENALDVLTSMPKKYPNHPSLTKVYLNLGDHYFRSQQYDNALWALKKALEDSSAIDVIPIAMRYLIRVYDSIRMWDAALMFARDYIDRFPKAEDILQKRVQIGIFYINLKEYTRAIEYLRKVKKDAEDPETEAEIQYWIGKCFYNMGQFEQAIYEFLKVMYLSKPTKLPWGTTALYESGQAYLKLEKPDQARKLFKKIVLQEGAESDLGRIARQRIKEIDQGEEKNE